MYSNHTLTNALTGTTLSSLPYGTTGAAYPSLTFPDVQWSFSITIN
jgi:hypothetical protein